MGNAKSLCGCTRGSSDGGSSEEDDAPAVRALTMPGPKTPRRGVNNKPADKKVDAVVQPKPMKNSSPGGGSKKKKDPRLVSDSAVQERRANPQLTKKVVNNKSTDKKVINNKSTDKKVDDIIPSKPMEKSSTSGSSQKNPPLVDDSAVHERQADLQLTKKVVVNSKPTDKKVVNNKSTHKKVDDIVPPKPMEKSFASGSSQKNPPLVDDSAVHEGQADAQLTKKVVNSKPTDKKVVNNKSTDKKVDDIVPPKPMEKSSASGSSKKNPPLIGDPAVSQADLLQLIDAPPKSSRKRDRKATYNKVDTVVLPKPMEKSFAGESCEKTGSRLVDVSAVQDPQLEAVLAEMQRHHHCHCQYVGHGTAAALAENNHHHHQQQLVLGAPAGAEQCPSTSYYKSVVAVDLVPTEASEEVRVLATADPVRRQKPTKKDHSLVDAPALQADPQLEAVLANMQRQAPPPAHHRQ